MTTGIALRARSAAAPGSRPMADTELLASALGHLLDRDRERPARWRTPGFAADVELARARLRQAVRVTQLPAPPAHLEPEFATVASLLGRDASAVALAIRHLEIARGGALPAWEDLVRRGAPATASALDVATWFG